MSAGFRGQMAPGGSAGCDMLESQTMTTDTVSPRPSSPRRGPPLDLVLHALQDALTGSAGLALNEHTTEECERLATLACALTRAINPGALAATWADDGEADIAGAHLARRLTNTIEAPVDISAQAAATAMRCPPGWKMGDPLPAPIKSPRPTSNAEGRTLETAVARRLADTACCLAITGDKEDAAQASALWGAAATLTGLLPPYTGDTLRAAADLVTAIGPVPGHRDTGFVRGLLKACAESAAKITGEQVTDHAAEQAGIIGAALRLVSATTKPTPRVLQSADEAPCGSLWARLSDGRLTLRLTAGSGRNIPPVDVKHTYSWPWDEANLDLDHDFPARLIAEGLTETECRHLSGLSAVEAIAWCEQRSNPAPGLQDTHTFLRGLLKSCAEEAAKITGVPVTIYAAEQAGVIGEALRYLKDSVTVQTRRADDWREEARAAINRVDEMKTAAECIRAALAVPGADDIVAHACKMKAQVDDLQSQADTLWKILGEHPNTLIASARLIKARAAENERLISERDVALATADRRLQGLHQADERDSLVREYLDADHTETSANAARRVAKERDEARTQRDQCAMREDAATSVCDAAVATVAHLRQVGEAYVFDALKGQREAKDELAAAIAVSEAVIKERDAALTQRDAAVRDMSTLRVLLGDVYVSEMLRHARPMTIAKTIIV